MFRECLISTRHHVESSKVAARRPLAPVFYGSIAASPFAAPEDDRGRGHTVPDQHTCIVKADIHALTKLPRSQEVLINDYCKNLQTSDRTLYYLTTI